MIMLAVCLCLVVRFGVVGDVYLEYGGQISSQLKVLAHRKYPSWKNCISVTLRVNEPRNTPDYLELPRK
jgi:hypothetical protein